MSAFISSTDNVYIFNNLGIFVTSSFSAKRNSKSVRLLKRTSPYLANLKTSAHAREKASLRDTVVSSRTFKIYHRKKNCRLFRLILTEVQNVLPNYFEQPSYLHEGKYTNFEVHNQISVKIQYHILSQLLLHYHRRSHH